MRRIQGEFDDFDVSGHFRGLLLAIERASREEVARSLPVWHAPPGREDEWMRHLQYVLLEAIGAAIEAGPAGRADDFVDRGTRARIRLPGADAGTPGPPARSSARR